MKILEIALIAQSPAMAKSIFHKMPFQSDIVLGIPTYRFELDANTVALFYDLVAARHLPDELLEHLSGHLQSLILLTDAGQSQMNPELVEKMESISAKLNGVRTVSAVLSQPDRLKNLSAAINEGIFLSDHGRILFWHPDVPDSQLRVWEHIWDIRTVGAAPEATA